MTKPPPARRRNSPGLAANRSMGLARAAACSLLALQVLTMAALPAQAAPACAAEGAAGCVQLNGATRLSYEDFVHELAQRALRREPAAKTPRPSAPASAAGAQGQPAPLNLTLDFELLDTNRDGRVSLEEMKAALRDNEAVRSLFKRLDANQDGLLDSSELGTALRSSVPQIDINF